MPPNKQTPVDSTSFDFILGTPEPEPVPFLKRVNIVRIIIAIVALIVFIIIFAVVMSNLSAKANQDQQNRLIYIEQLQTEIMRTAAIGEVRSTDSDIKTRSKAINSGITDARTKVQALLEARNGSTTDDELNALVDPKTDDLLQKAEQYTNFDETYTKIINAKIVEYQQAILAAEKSGTKTEKQILEENYKDADAMLGLVDQL